MNLYLWVGNVASGSLYTSYHLDCSMLYEHPGDKLFLHSILLFGLSNNRFKFLYFVFKEHHITFYQK